MATPTGSSGGRPSDPKDLIFEGDRESLTAAPQKKWRLRPGRIMLSLAIAGLVMWFHSQASDWISTRIEPFVPGWIYLICLCLGGLASLVIVYRWLKT